MNTPPRTSLLRRCVAGALLGLALFGAGCSAYRPDPGSIPDFPDEHRTPPAPVADAVSETASAG